LGKGKGDVSCSRRSEKEGGHPNLKGKGKTVTNPPAMRRSTWRNYAAKKKEATTAKKKQVIPFKKKKRGEKTAASIPQKARGEKKGRRRA